MIDSVVEVAAISVPGQQKHYGLPFPLALECRGGPSLDAAYRWLASHAESLLRQASEHGAILFRGFPLTTAEDFDRFVTAFDLPNFPYDESLSNAVRVNRTPRVFTANEAPPTATILFHHEMAQTPVYPSRLFFFCETPAATGGATPLCRSDVLWDRIEAQRPDFARRCRELGLCYSLVMPDGNDAQSGLGRSWQTTLRANTPEAAEARLRELGYRWEWLEDACLRATTPVLPAVRELSGGRRSFFNQLIAAFQGWKDSRNDPAKSVSFGDGTPMDADAVRLAAELAEQLAFDVPWQAGDVALVDNFVAMHGRRTFTGVRKVLASLVDKQVSAALTAAH